MGTLTVETFGAWLEAYGLASREGDARASAALFSPDASYQESPFDPPMVGREAIERYWAGGAGRFADKRSGFEILAIDGDRGVARWWSTFQVVDTGRRVSLECLFVADFDVAGQCTAFREWWHARGSEDVGA